MYNLIYNKYQNKLLAGFSDVELELFEYIINSTPEVMLAYKDKDNNLELNHGYIVLLVLLAKTLGPSRELILNTAHAKDLQRLYELADTITNLTGFTWVANNDLSFPMDNFNYSINFTSNNTSYTTFKTEMSFAYDLYYNDQGVYLSTEDGTDWVHSDYKTIQITGGSDVTNSTLISWLEENGTLSPKHLKGPSFKLLQLLAGDIWPDILELFTSEEEARSVLYGKIDLVEAMVPIIRKRGTLDSLLTILNSYIPHHGLAADKDDPMKAYMKLNNENDLYGNRQLYKLLLHAKPAGYKIGVSTREYPFYETASPALITDSTNPVMPWISGMSNGIYPYFGSPLQTPDITDVRVAGGILGPATLAVTFKNKHFEPLKATISAEGTYQIGSKTYNADLTPVVYTISDREPSLTPQNVYRTINNSFPVNITITKVKVKIEPHNSGIPGDNRSAEATFDISSPGIILAPTPSPIPIEQPTISNINLNENLFTASIDITNNDLVALSGTLAVKESNNYKVAFTDLMPGETRTLTITHPNLYSKEELLLEATRDNDVGPALTHPIDVAPDIPGDPYILPRLDTPTPVISTLFITEAYGNTTFQIIAKNTDPVFPVWCYGTLHLYADPLIDVYDDIDVTIPAGGTSVLYSIPYYGDPSATVEFDLTAECAVYTGPPYESIKNPVTHTYTTDFSTQPDLPPDSE